VRKRWCAGNLRCRQAFPPIFASNRSLPLLTLQIISQQQSYIFSTLVSTHIHIPITSLSSKSSSCNFTHSQCIFFFCSFGMTTRLVCQVRWHDIPPYAINTHTWGEDHEEVTFKDRTEGTNTRGPVSHSSTTSRMI
jgi:hypothetical protein